jgi:hypothetical protein
MAALQYSEMRLWKIVGLAGIVGATAAGVTVGARAVKRQRRMYREVDPDELRTRLHARLEAAGPS